MRQDKVPTLKDYDFNLSADLRLGELQVRGMPRGGRCNDGKCTLAPRLCSRR